MSDDESGGEGSDGSSAESEPLLDGTIIQNSKDEETDSENSDE